RLIAWLIIGFWIVTIHSLFLLENKFLLNGRFFSINFFISRLVYESFKAKQARAKALGVLKLVNACHAWVKGTGCTIGLINFMTCRCPLSIYCFNSGSILKRYKPNNGYKWLSSVRQMTDLPSACVI